MRYFIIFFVSISYSIPSFTQNLFPYNDTINKEIQLPAVIELHDINKNLDYTSALGASYHATMNFGKRKFVLNIFDNNKKLVWSQDYKLNDRRNGYFKKTRTSVIDEEYTLDKSTDDYTETTVVTFTKNANKLTVALTILRKKTKSKKADVYIAAGG